MFRSNTVNGTGGGIWLHSEAVNTHPLLAFSSFDSNTAAYGGGLYAEYKTVQQFNINKCKIVSNTARISGAGTGLAWIAEDC